MRYNLPTIGVTMSGSMPYFPSQVTVTTNEVECMAFAEAFNSGLKFREVGNSNTIYQKVVTYTSDTSVRIGDRYYYSYNFSLDTLLSPERKYLTITEE